MLLHIIVIQGNIGQLLYTQMYIYNIYTIVPLFCENGFVTSMAKPKRSSFRAKHINDRMFIENLVM
jgi:hypothetical protein